jgi:hypothetical protein
MQRVAIIVILIEGLAFSTFAASIQIFRPEQYNELGRFTETTIRSALPEMGKMYGKTDKPIRFILVSSDSDFIRYTGTRLPDWVGAATIFPPGIVIMKTPDYAHTTLRQYRTTILHELVHLTMGQSVPLNLMPVWFSEGLAIYFSEEFDSRSRVVVSFAMLKKRLISLDRLSDFLRLGQPTAELAYAESGTVIEYLASAYGVTVFQEIQTAMKRGKDFEMALALATNIEPADFEFHWREYLSKNYQWVFLLDIQYILWVVMTILVVLAWLSIRERNKKTVRKWDEQEQKEQVYFGKM